MKNFRIHPATFLFLILLAVSGFGVIIIPYLIAVTLHELGHAYAAKKLGYQLNTVWILPYGACISFEEFSFEPNDEIKIAFAGPLVNIILVIISIAFWWLFPTTYVYTYTFAVANFYIALFNLLPAYPLDGGRILTGGLRSQFKSKIVYKIASILNFAFSGIFLILFIVSCFWGINYSLGLMAVFLFLGTFEGKFQGKYSPILYKFSKKKNNRPAKVKNFCVESSTPFYKIIPEMHRNKYNIIYVIYPKDGLKLITETEFQKILEENSIDQCFDDLLKKKELKKDERES